ncbi:DMT family transporter [Ferrovibrio sp.]|uniref:DMT family transporter n=1 Tax=Ferrovibrio sp. TaxID=1917215 RepID=UPI001B6876B7|nr:DMT family transporter [Ferrovibrio sp.]MBP7064585.1 DMT family transporter [Ferrovibrio sp.]
MQNKLVGKSGALEPKLAAALWVLGASFAFALLYASGKLSGGLVPALQIVWIRYVSGFVTVGGIAAARRVRLRQLLETRRRHLHLLRACCGIFGGACSIYGATHMPLADAAALALLQGVFVMILAVLLLGERLRLAQMLAALLCLGGAFVIVRGDSGGGGFALAGLAPYAVMLGALLTASEIILIKILSRDESMLSMLLHVNGIAALLFALPVLWLWQAAPWPVLAALCLLGPMAIVGQMCNVRAYRLADAAFLAPFGYSSVAFSALIGWVAFGDLPSLATWAGTALIVAGGLALIRR